MIKRIYSVKALVFLLVLILASGSLSYTFAAAPPLTHVGQPVENLITLDYDVSDDCFYQTSAKPGFDSDEAFVVPQGYNLVVTDIYYVTNRSENPMSGPVWLEVTDPNGKQHFMFYQFPHILTYSNGNMSAELNEHFATGFVFESGRKITSSRNSAIAIFTLRGYLVSTTPVAASTTPAVTTTPAAPAPTPTAAATGTSPAVISPSDKSAPDPWAGVWMTSNKNLGVMELSLTGSSAIGTLGGGIYLLSGTVSGRTFTADWMEPETSFGGKLELTISEDGKSFTGRWNSSNSLGWQTLTGKRQ